MAEIFPLKVFGARAVIRLEEPEQTSLGGIIIPNAQDEPANQGTVVAVGEGQRLDNGTLFPMTLKVGDKVIYSPMAGSPVEVEGDENKYLVINEGHVLCVVE
jgi:chaperonin GroES